MNKTELIDDAKRSVKSYIERELEARNERMVYPVVAIKLDHTPEGEWDGINNAVLVSEDGKTGNIHLYIMTCIMHKRAVQEMFDTEIDDYVGHVIIDDEEKDEKYFQIVEKFGLDAIRNKIKEMKAESEKKKQRWSNI